MSQGIKKISENVIAQGRSLTIVNNSVRDNTNFEIGTLKCYPTDFGLRFKSNNNTYSLFNAINILDTHTIQEKLMANNSVSTRTIIDKNITTSKLKDYCVTNIKIENKSSTTGIIGYEKIKDQTITTAELKDFCVVNSKIHDKTINASEKILNETITTELLRGGIDINGVEVPGCVTTPKIANENITTKKLYNKCVTNEKLADNNIENIKLKDLTIQGGNEPGIGKIAEKTITNFNIANKTLNNLNFANGSVTGYGIDNAESIIADNTISNLNIVNNTIENNKIATRTIQGASASDGGKIALHTITGDNILDSSIPATKLDPSTLNIVNNAVLYERDAQNKLCVKLRKQTNDATEESCYMNITGHLDVVGDITGARVYNMAYSDLAEGYIPGEEVNVGDIVSIHEDNKIYKTTFDYRYSIVGIVSDQYAACYGATKEELKNKEKVAISLIGKVLVKVKGNVKLGQRIVFPINPFSEAGIGQALLKHNNTNDCIIGKALESNEINNFDEISKVLCLVFPN